MRTDNSKIPPKSMIIVYGTTLVVGIFFRLFFRLRSYGKEKIRKLEPPYIVVFNHTSHLDSLSIALCMGTKHAKKIVPFGKKELFESRLIGWIVRGLGAYPINRDELDISAARSSLYVLRSGMSILIAPEGTRSVTGKVDEFNDGFIKIALKTGVPILPVGIKGAFRALPKHSLIPRPAKVTVHFGDTFLVSDLADRNHLNGDAGTLAQLVREIILKLVE